MSRSSPVSLTPRYSTRGCASPRCPASTCTANRIRFACRGPSEIRDRIDLLELATMWTRRVPGAAHLQPARGAVAGRSSRASSTSCTTIRVSAPACSGSPQPGLPVVATVHHPITRDRVLDLAAARWWRKPLVHRWYGFLRMQQQVSRQHSRTADGLVVVGGRHRDRLRGVARAAACRAAGCEHRRCSNRRRGRAGPAVSSRSPARTPRSRVLARCCTRSSRLRVERDLELQLVAKVEPNGPTHKLIAELGISDIVHITSGLSGRRNSRRCSRPPKWRAYPRSTKGFRYPP